MAGSLLIDSFELRIEAASLGTVEINLEWKSTRRMLNADGRSRRG